MLPEIHVIHINDADNKHSIRRKKQFTKEFINQGTEYKIVDAVVDKDIPRLGCTKSHKKIVRYARNHNLPFIVIAEDDIVFSDKNSYQFYIDNMPKEFDIYFGMIYHGKTTETGFLRSTFHGTTMYCVHNRFYDEFIALDENNHLDIILGQLVFKKLFYVCLPMVCYQSDTFSFVKNGVYDVNVLAKGLKFYDGKSGK